MITDNDHQFYKTTGSSSKSSIICVGVVNMITGEDKFVFLEGDLKNLELLPYLIENEFFSWFYPSSE